MARTPKPWYRKDRQAWFVTIDGTRHNLGRNRKAAFQRFHELMAQPRSQRQLPSETVIAVIDAFLEWTQKHRAKATYEWYLERCQWFIKTIDVSLTVSQLKPFHVQEWVDSHPSWSDGHTRGCIIAVQRPLRWALKMGLIDKNPLEFVEKPQGGHREEVITQEECNAIIALVRDEQFRDLLTVAWETGARPQELLRVEARHVDLANSRWIFPADEAKGRKRARVVYLSDEATAITRRLVLKHANGPIFRNRAGRPWTPYAVSCRFERLKRKLGKKYCLYLFRHSFATHMLESGMDALTVSVLMGHADTTMLSRVYQHLSHNPQKLLNQIRKAAG